MHSYLAFFFWLTRIPVLNLSPDLRFSRLIRSPTVFGLRLLSITVFSDRDIRSPEFKELDRYKIREKGRKSSSRHPHWDRPEIWGPSSYQIFCFAKVARAYAYFGDTQRHIIYRNIVSTNPNRLITLKKVFNHTWKVLRQLVHNYCTFQKQIKNKLEKIWIFGTKVGNI